MKACTTLTLALAVAAAIPLSLQASRSDPAEADRYAVIVRSRLFGAPPPAPKPKTDRQAVKKPLAPLEKLVRLTSIIAVGDEPIAYLENIRAKEYVALRAGESDETMEILLVDIDYDGGRVRVRRDGDDDYWLGLYDVSIAKKETPREKPVAAAKPPSRPWVGEQPEYKPVPIPSVGEVERPWLSPAVNAHVTQVMRASQLHRILSGKEAFSHVKLTPEQDAYLVELGLIDEGESATPDK